jgi:hypothetical protein
VLERSKTISRFKVSCRAENIEQNKKLGDWKPIEIDIIVDG